MLRIFLLLLAVLLAALGYVFERPWLYVGAGVPVLGVLGHYGWAVWSSYRSHRRHAGPSPSDEPPEEELEDYGIVDVRPEEDESRPAARPVSEGASPTPTDEASAQSTPRSVSPGAATETPDSNPAPAPPPSDAVATEDEEETVAAPPPTKSPALAERPVLDPLLESARAALGAYSACLLVQEEVALEYRIAACASKSPEARREGTFQTSAPLLTASMAHRSVTVRALEEDDRADLQYYQDPPAVLAQMAVAPLPRPDDSATVFLLADAMGGVDLDTPQRRSSLEQYAETLSRLVDLGATEAHSDEEEASDEEGGDGSEDEPDRVPSPDGLPSASGEPDGDSDHRPRRDIIAEEMETTDQAEEPLALAFVHLNRAESIARQGKEAVDQAEQLLRARLEDRAPGARVEPFGELTYGVFVREDDEAVEAWAVDLQEAMGQETGALEGGVSVGVAVRTEDIADPDRLRTNATRALREAYETGTCTIVA